MSTKRKDHLRALFGADLPSLAPTQTESATPEPEAKPHPPVEQRSSSGAVKAMGLSLSSMTRELDEARALKEQLAGGDRVIELDPAKIDPSIVRDRLSREDVGDEEFQPLVESLRENGQQVPVLVRPHPTSPGRYQTAYGHRRIRAAASLAIPVRAIVRELSDAELVLAQGKENTERRSLSFIERAFFAQSLIHHGFERGIVERALSLHKAEMTRYLQVASGIPTHIASAIGPAPKAGRPRWMALSEFFRNPAAAVIAAEEVHSEPFRQASSDERFRRLYVRLERRARPPVKKPQAPREINDDAGRVLARLTDGPKPRLEFDENAKPGFAAYVAEVLPELVARFEQEATTDS
ncbi:plasmid partitioning protein RepB [Aquamicrobium sp. LC103]|uniref:plasmid partitioning protein RepB n=1 Tax=Aquamicrobium sp. LC103 TaxID=1120658 RepID=UPI00063EA5EC|nr:plasmid partitioning protein RepB [Aquamicrobium sp. LC103]TKT75861.1 plasmid partitioning protein RepB [Aquamicrobium sp. LC103]